MNTRTTPTLLLALALLTPLARADDTAPNLQPITQAMKPFVDNRELPGLVTLVTSKDKILHTSALGLSNVETHTAMKPDSIFWIASMTKPITAAAVLALQEDGKLNVDDPVSKYIPELANLKTKEGQTPTITLRHILSHTSGMPEATSEQSKNARTLADLIPAYAAKPLSFAPGSKWSYCQSGINTAARIVEIVSGQPFPDFIEARFFKPLGMKDTTFYPTEAQMPRIVIAYKRSADGKFEPTTNLILQGKSPLDTNRYPAANGGLYSTAPDYARFCQMLLNHGAFEGKTLLKPESIKHLSTITTGDLKTGFTPGNGWAIGCCVIKEPQGVTAMLSPGAYGHGGAFGTQAWIDPTKGVAYVLMIQRANFANMGGADGSAFRQTFQQAAADALRGE